MAQKEPSLNLTFIDTHSRDTMGIADLSYYPTSWNIVSPTLSVDVPGFGKKLLPFSPNSLQVLNSEVLGVTCEGECTAPLPDGIYKLRYTITPAYKYYVDKTFIRVEKLWEKFDQYFLSLQLNCNPATTPIRRMIEEIELDIEGAVAAANHCATDLALTLYRKADKKLDNLLQNG
jgi:hypothetical protein